MPRKLSTGSRRLSTESPRKKKDKGPPSIATLRKLRNRSSSEWLELPDSDEYSVNLNLAKGSLDGIPFIDLLKYMYKHDSGKTLVRGVLKASQQGDEKGDIDVKIEILDSTYSLDSPTSRERKQKGSGIRGKDANDYVNCLEIKNIRINMEVGLKDHVSPKENDTKQEPKRASEEKPTASTKSSVTAAKRRHLVKTISTRASKPRDGGNSHELKAQMKAFSLLDVRSFFKSEDKGSTKKKKKRPSSHRAKRKNSASKHLVESSHSDSKSKGSPRTPKKSPKQKKSKDSTKSKGKEKEAPEKNTTTVSESPKNSPRNSSPKNARKSPKTPKMLQNEEEKEKTRRLKRQSTWDTLLESSTEETKPIEYTSKTIPSRLMERAQRHPDQPAYFVKYTDKLLKQQGKVTASWKPVNFAEYATLVRQAGRALIDLHAQPGDRAAIVGTNSPEWVIFYVACLSVGVVPTGIALGPSKDVASLIENTKSTIVFIDNLLLWEGVKKENSLECVDHIIFKTRRKKQSSEQKSEEGENSSVVENKVNKEEWKVFLQRGGRVQYCKGSFGGGLHASDDPIIDAELEKQEHIVELDRELEARLEALNPEDLAVLTYTTGTTGKPKGVKLSHQSIYWTTDTVSTHLSITERDCMISFLPLAHIAEEMLSIFIPIMSGCRIYFHQGPLQTLHTTLHEVQPTLLFAPPDLYTKLYHIFRDKLDKKKVEHTTLDALFTAVGLARVRFSAAGYGYVPQEILEYFQELGFTINEMYGQTEVCGPAAFNVTSGKCMGSAGLPLPGVKFHIDANGRLLINGPNVFMGYLDDEEATENVLKDGWVNTGDFAFLDDDGFLYLNGRNDDLITSCDGKTVDPAKLENSLKLLPLINNVAVFGNARPYLTAVVALDPAVMTKISEEKELNSVRELYSPPHINEITGSIQTHVVAVNKKIPKGYPCLKRFTVLRKQFSIERGELTITNQVRRSVIAEHYGKEIEKMYSDINLRRKKSHGLSRSSNPKDSKDSPKGTKDTNPNNSDSANADSGE
eukprot:CAMPEP_0174254852 /NCGR_PEP_ID=MMETSP0439-20130205/4198_1 /TAXON_ID=0 /ORGANISM="Stereomyxa ramosa, Strain Chinc5" /LENGTH=1025 /DNA_ID=CAMNT_0015336719 /DNA_START=75 /DNA_END=3152 /DNA_ORIENTATION=-